MEKHNKTLRQIGRPALYSECDYFANTEAMMMLMDLSALVRSSMHHSDKMHDCCMEDGG